MRSNTYNLNAIPQLYPVLEDEDGKLIDGNHRLAANPNWKRMKVEGIKGEKLHLLAQIAANTQRRRVTSRERTRQFTALAEIVSSEGFKPGEISYELSRLTGFCSWYVNKHIPLKYKDVSHIRNHPTDLQCIHLGNGVRFFIHMHELKFLMDESKRTGTARSAIVAALIDYWKHHPTIIDLSKLRHYGGNRVKRVALTGEPIQ